MRFRVISNCVNRVSGERYCEPCIEIIDTEKHQGFSGIRTAYDIKMRVESFWNSIKKDSKEVVFVQEVLII